ncbi:MAG: tripartite tricarboxylate transporter substrate binding protein [Betaproteobacteria bacterium]|nr:MAG: tripartite tricarboxylate transporter substrate binding protein [Betaproteobacteria bacterium]
MKTKVLLFFSLLAASAAIGGAWAQNFPTKPIRVINPASPGGNSEFFFRLLSAKMSETIGQNFVMDYRPGAGGTIGGDIIAKSPPDGYTTGLVAASFVINPSTYKKLPFDTAKDFTPLGIIVDVPSGLVIHPSMPVKSVTELIALARQKPGQIFFSSSGRGGIGHLAGEMLNSAAKIQLVHVAYKGAGPALVDLIAGHVQMLFASMPLLFPHVQAGKVRLLAQTGSKRSVSLQNVPTMQEAGVPGYVVRSMFGFIGPAGIPRPIAEKLNGALATAIKDPKNNKTLVARGADPVGSSIDEHRAAILSELAKWKKVAKEAGVKPI